VFIRPRLLILGGPVKLIQFVLLIGLGDFDFDPIKALEMFAGNHAVTTADLAAGFLAVAFEILLDPEGFDFMGDIGFCNAILLSLSLEPGGKGLAAPVCSSYSWMSRHTTGRRKHRPLGHRRFVKVVRANTMVARVILQIWVWQALGIWWVVEQPGRSVMEYHPRFQELFRRFTIYKKHICMGNYGADTRKATILYSNSEEALNNLDAYAKPLKKQKKKLVRVRQVKGKKKVTGLAGELKESQAYPQGFGDAMTAVYLAHEDEFQVQVPTLYTCKQFHCMLTTAINKPEWQHNLYVISRLVTNTINMAC
jgi:type IV secretory pathway TrbD component